MRFYFYPFLAQIAQLLPPLAVVPRWSRSTAARRWIAVWALLFFLSDGLQLYMSERIGNNRLLIAALQPLEDAILLWALSFWQTRPLTRMALRIAIPLVIAIYVTVGFATGELTTFQTFSGPFRALLMMICTVYTLISNVAASPERVWQHDWLWTTIGVLLYFGLLVAVEPIAAAMGTDHLDNMMRLYNARSIGDVIAFIIIWRGMRCPLPSSSTGST